MKAQPLKLTQEPPGYLICDAAEATHVMLNLPGPIPTRILPVIQRGTRDGTGCWSWNGSTEAPTLKPSILSQTHQGDLEIRCHTFVNDGKVQFLSDCSHEFAGQTLDLLEVE